MAANIAVVINAISSGGAERAAVNLVNGLADDGFEVTLITFCAGEGDFYRVKPGVQRISLNLAQPSRTALNAIFHNAVRVLSLRRVLRALRPDVAVGFMTTTNVVLALAGLGLERTRVVISERIYPPMQPVGRAWSLLRKATYPLSSLVVMLTNEGLHWLAREIPKARGVVIPNAVAYPLPSFGETTAPGASVPPDRELMLAAGRFAEQKGFDLLLEAFASVAARHPTWHLVILGDGPLRSTLEAQRAQLGIRDRVHMPGVVGNMGDWYERADVYVMSSRFEGFPNALAEAMSYGCAVVSYDCDTGPRDLIRHNLDGILVRPVGDVAALARALSELMGDEAKRRRIAAPAMQIRERYSPERVMQMWERTLFGTTAQVCKPAVASLAGLPDVER
jgi:glycosyltransferase involved in cell wall biosynthesis